MAAKPQGESKAPIIIALAFFVLTTLTLGVLFYMGLDAQANAKADAKKANDEATLKNKSFEIEQGKVLMYREALGINTPDQTSDLKATKHKDEVQKEQKKLMQELSDRIAGTPTTPSIVAEAQREIPGTKFDVKMADVMVWEWQDGTDMKEGPKKGLFAVVVNAYAKQLLASQKQAAAEKNAKDAADSYQKLNAEYTTAVQTLKNAAAAFPKQVSEEAAKEKAKVDAYIKKFDAQTDDFQKTLAEKSTAFETEKIKAEQLEKAKKSFEERAKAAETKLANRQDPFEFEKHHGRITARKGNVVYIDLGSADRVRAGLTFTVQPSDTPERGIDSRKESRKNSDGKLEVTIRTKGTIEVTEVLGDHLSQGRVSGETDPIRESLMVGDTLYNAAWRKGSSERVALFGVFDTDADGSDDTKALVRELTKMGIIVDAYYDIDQKKWIGNITGLTNFVIEGYYPTTTVADPLGAAKSAISSNLDAARVVAQEKGIKIIKARDFLPRIGYRMNLNVTPDTINRAFNKYLQVTEAPPMGEAPKN
ncbi:MAG: hypothetical protein ACRC8S_07415 [Fimbriiglobus sp.]